MQCGGISLPKTAENLGGGCKLENTHNIYRPLSMVGLTKAKLEATIFSRWVTCWSQEKGLSINTYGINKNTIEAPRSSAILAKTLREPHWYSLSFI
jgi:hypothetical protein